MTIEALNAFSGPYYPNGATTAFPFTFQVADASEVMVEIDGATVSSALYTVAVAPSGTGTVTFLVAPASGILFVGSNPYFGQTVNFETQGPFYQRDLNNPLDRASIRDIWLRDRSLRAPAIPRGVDVAGKYPVVAPGGVGFVWSSGTGADGGLRKDLASKDGAKFIGVAGGGTLAELLKDFVVQGLRSLGQVLVSTTTSLVFATHAGRVVLANDDGITITFPATGFSNGSIIALSNISTGSITLAFPGGSDAATTLQAGRSVLLHADGTGFWRSLFANNREGLRSTGQVVLTGSTVLSAATHSSANILVGTAGVTITLPATGFVAGQGVAISNASNGSITLAYPGGGDGPTTLLAGGSALFFSDGGGFWRSYFYSPGRGGAVPSTVNGSGRNDFPNSEWQIFSAIGPGWGGAEANLNAYLDAFDTRQNWNYSGIVFPHIAVSNISVSTGLGEQKIVTAQGDSFVQFLYPGALIAFTPASIAASVANPALLQSTLRVLSVNYTNLTFTFYPPRNGRYSGGTGPATGAVNYVCRQVMRGGTQSVGTGNGPDGWLKSAAATIYVDEWPEISNGFGSGQTFVGGASAPNKPGWTCNLRPSMKRALVFVPAADGDYIGHNKTVAEARRYRGRNIVWGAWVRGQVGTTISLGIASNAILDTASAPIAATGNWQWVEWTYPVPTNATDLTLSFKFGSSINKPWSIAHPRFDFGTLLGEGNYVPSSAATLPFITQIVPATFFGADFTASEGGIIDWYGETGGQVASDTFGLSCVLEGTSTAAGKPLFVISNAAAPTRYGGAMFTYEVAKPMAQPFQMHLLNGTSWMDSASGDVWTNVSIDISYAIMT